MQRSNPSVFNQPFVPRVYVREPIRWEYFVLNLSADEPPGEERLNELGDEGWELVAALPDALYFKRLVD